MTVLAFLTQLVYFDYVAVEESARLKARDNKLDAVLLLEGRESEERKGSEESEVRLRRSERNRLIGCCEGIERLWDVMVDKDVEWRKLRGLPGVTERVSVYEGKMDVAVREYEEEMYGVGEQKREEEGKVREAMEAINRRAETECKASMKQFQHDKKQLRAQYELLLSHPPPLDTAAASTGSLGSTAVSVSVSSPLLPTLTALLNRYHTLLHGHISHLMHVQSELTHHTSLLLAAFDSALHELSVQWSTRTQQSFQVLLAVSKQYHDGLHDHIGVLLDAAANNSSSSGSTAKDDTSGRVDKQSSGGDGSTEATAAGAVSGSSGGSGGSVGGRVLLTDKETLMSAMSASRDCHDSLIMAKEDELREREERDVKERLSRWRADMIEQNRARVCEIYEMKKSEEGVIEEMMEKLSGEDEEEDGDATEPR